MLADSLFSLSVNRVGGFINQILKTIQALPQGSEAMLKLQRALAVAEVSDSAYSDFDERFCEEPLDEDGGEASTPKEKKRRILPPSECHLAGYAEFIFWLCESGWLWKIEDPIALVDAFLTSRHLSKEPKSDDSAPAQIDLGVLRGLICKDIAYWQTLNPKLNLKNVLHYLLYKAEKPVDVECSWQAKLVLAFVESRFEGTLNLAHKVLEEAGIKEPRAKHVESIWQPSLAASMIKKWPNLSVDDAESEDWYRQSVFWELAPLSARYSASGPRDHHKHGACLYLRVDALFDRKDEIGELARQFKSWRETIISFGRNKAMKTRFWGKLNGRERHVGCDGRWKVIHAEMDALCRTVQQESLRGLFAPIATQDWESYGEGVSVEPLARPEIGPLDPKILRIAELFKSEWPTDEANPEYCGPLGVVVVELSNDGVRFDDSQACPSVSTKCLYKVEKVRKNESLVAESLRAGLAQIKWQGEVDSTTASSNPLTRDSAGQPQQTEAAIDQTSS